ncbi:MAG: ABC transporter ATP-binding protein [Promethearchaeota archaeon]
MNNIVIDFQNVSKFYKKTKALDEISFKIKKGDVFGYIGPNGAGKTTTIKIIVGLIKQFSGKVIINGIDIKKEPGMQSKLIGYHPQEVGFQRWKTVYQTLRTFGRLSNFNKGELDKKINDILEFIGLLDVKNKKVIHLSGGMIQKLRLAQALLNDPEILLLDEPLAGLDPASRFQIKNLIKQLSAKRITIFFSSHILNDVQDVATKIGIINKGKILKISTSRDLQEEYKIGNYIQIGYATKKDIVVNYENLKFVDTISMPTDYSQIIKIKPDIDIDLAINEILKLILSENKKIRGLKILKPSLEDIYLKIISEDKR